MSLPTNKPVLKRSINELLIDEAACSGDDHEDDYDEEAELENDDDRAFIADSDEEDDERPDLPDDVGQYEDGLQDTDDEEELAAEVQAGVIQTIQ